MELLTPKLRAQIEDDCRKNEVAELTVGFILDWADTTTDGTARALLASVEMGMLEVAGWDGEEAFFRMTPAAHQYLESHRER